MIYARKMRQLTQAQLASMIPCRQSTVGNIEAGRNIRMRDPTAFARALRVPADWLAEGKGPLPTASGAPPPNHPTRIGAGRRSSDHENWPFAVSRDDFHRLLTPDQIEALDAIITTYANQHPQRKYGNSA